MAGESAEISARPMRERARRLRLVAARYERRAADERRTAHALESLPTEEWQVFHDIAWPGRRYASIDHVVIGPPGVFVIDSQHWTGRVTVEGGVLHRNGRPRDAATLAAAEAAASIKKLVVAVQDIPVHAVLCFAGDLELFGLADDAVLCSTDTVATVLRTRQGVVARGIREDVARQLAEKLGDRTTVRNVVPAQRLRIFLPEPSRLPTPPPGRPTGRLRRSDIASVAVGVSLAVGSLALVASGSETLGDLGQAVVDLVSNDSAPERQPEIQMPTGYEPPTQEAR